MTRTEARSDAQTWLRERSEGNEHDQEDWYESEHWFYDANSAVARLGARAHGRRGHGIPGNAPKPTYQTTNVDGDRRQWDRNNALHLRA